MRWSTWVAGAALGLSLLGIGAGDFDRQIDHAAQEIDALTLARWIRNRTPHLLVAMTEDGQFPLVTIPGSLTPEQALAALEGGTAPETVVVYAFEHSDQWRRVQRFNPSLYFLRNGAQQWFDSILAPTAARDSSAQLLMQFEKQAELSRYFGGVPRLVDAADPTPSSEATINAAKRRGCGF